MFWAIARSYKRHGVKYVFDHHDVCPELYLSKYRRRDLFYRGLCWMERKQYQHADAVIATNTSYRDIALERGEKKLEDVTVVRSGPMRSRFRLAVPDESLKRGRKHLVVYLGVKVPRTAIPKRPLGRNATRPNLWPAISSNPVLHVVCRHHHI